MGVCRSRTNADDRLPADPLGRIEGGDGIVEGRDLADVRPQSSVPHPLDDLTQLGKIGGDNKVDRQSGPRRPLLWRAGLGADLLARAGGLFVTCVPAGRCLPAGNNSQDRIVRGSSLISY